LLFVKKSVYQVQSGKTLIWPLIEAEYLRGGLARKAAAKNTTRSAAQVWRFFIAALAVAFRAEEG
jgi:hypothetical protein